MIKRAFFLFFIFICFALSLCAQDAKVSVLPANDKVFVGDALNYKINVELPQHSNISAGQNFILENFDVLSYDVNHISLSPNVYELGLKIAAYKTGALMVEPIKINYIDASGAGAEFFTPESIVDIESVDPHGAGQDIKDIKPLKKIKIKTEYIFLLALIAVCFVFTVYALVKNIIVKIKALAPVLLVIDPKTEALKKLSDLRYLYEQKETGIKQLYYKMSEILRGYVSQKYKCNALEMTTSEFLNEIKNILPADLNMNEVKKYLKVFVYARYSDFEPEDAETLNCFDFTKMLLEKL